MIIEGIECQASCDADAANAAIEHLRAAWTVPAKG